VHWWQFALLGAGGGALVEVLTIFKWLAVWQSARRTQAGRLKERPPALRFYIDLPVHGWIVVARSALGAAIAVLFGVSGQITGPYVVVALGFAAPSVLAQFGTIPQVAAAIRGTSASAPPQISTRRNPSGSVGEPMPRTEGTEDASEQ
jgi:hypothetical protein